MYENYPKICITAFCICIFAYCFSPWKDMSIRIENVSAKEIQTATGKTATGVSMEIPTWGKEDWKWKKKTNNTWISWNVRWDKMKSDYMMTNSTCNAECKISELSKKGIRDEIARSLVINCKDLAKDPVMCIKIWASIVKNESWGWYVCKKYNKYNCMWLGVKDQYKSYNDWVLHWVGKYNKRWYKAKNMSFFYSPAWKLPPSSYCTSEDSSNTAIGCPNWLRISSSFFNSLSF